MMLPWALRLICLSSAMTFGQRNGRQIVLRPCAPAAEYNERIEAPAQGYPQVALLKQIKGVGTLIALTFMLTLEDPHRFRQSRDVGCAGI